jgi:hypothetical protein
LPRSGDGSVAYGQAAKEYREWSQKNWQAVANVQTYVNPHDTRTPVELPNTYQYFWVNEKGVIGGTNDPSVNPNTGSTSDWRKMPKREP